MEFSDRLKNISDSLQPIMSEMKVIEDRTKQIPMQKGTLQDERNISEDSKKNEESNNTIKQYALCVTNPVRHENYEKILLNWEKSYGTAGDRVALLEENKNKTIISYTNDPTKLNKQISDTDIVMYGLYSFSAAVDEGKKQDMSNLIDLFSVLQISPDEVGSIQKSLKTQKDFVYNITHSCEQLKQQMKGLLINKRQLKDDNEKLMSRAHQLEKQLGEHATNEELDAMAKDIETMKNKIADLNVDHIKAIKSKQHFQKCLRYEGRSRNDYEKQMKTQLKELKKNNQALKRFGEKISVQASHVISTQLVSFSEFLVQTSKLRSMLDKARALLELRSSHIGKLDQEVAAEKDFLLNMKENLSSMENTNEVLQAKLEDILSNTYNLKDNVHKIHVELMDIIAKFNAASAHINKDMGLIQGERKNEKKLEQMLEVLFDQNKVIDKISKKINCLEKNVSKMSTETKEEMETIVTDYEYFDENREIISWDQKVLSIWKRVEELDNAIEDAIEEELREKDAQAVKKEQSHDSFESAEIEENYDVHSANAKYVLSSSFKTGTINRGEFLTISGSDSITKESHKQLS